VDLLNPAIVNNVPLKIKIILENECFIGQRPTHKVIFRPTDTKKTISVTLIMLAENI